jgi:hypothetical protein
MPIKNPAAELQKAPINDLIFELLRQFKRLLEAQQIELSHADMQRSARQAAEKQPVPKQAELVQAMRTIVDESVRELQERFDLNFAQALATPNVQGWQTTAEFLQLHNVKSNAELRISAGAALLAMLGDAHHAGHLLTVIRQDAGANDVDAVFARRALSHLTGVAPRAEDWLAQVQRALADT